MKKSFNSLLFTVLFSFFLCQSCSSDIELLEDIATDITLTRSGETLDYVIFKVFPGYEIECIDSEVEHISADMPDSFFYDDTYMTAPDPPLPVLCTKSMIYQNDTANVWHTFRSTPKGDYTWYGQNCHVTQGQGSAYSWATVKFNTIGRAHIQCKQYAYPASIVYTRAAGSFLVYPRTSEGELTVEDSGFSSLGFKPTLKFSHPSLSQFSNFNWTFEGGSATIVQGQGSQTIQISTNQVSHYVTLTANINYDGGSFTYRQSWRINIDPHFSDAVFLITSPGRDVDRQFLEVNESYDFIVNAPAYENDPDFKVILITANNSLNLSTNYQEKAFSITPTSIGKFNINVTFEVGPYSRTIAFPIRVVNQVDNILTINVMEEEITLNKRVSDGQTYNFYSYPITVTSQYPVSSELKMQFISHISMDGKYVSLGAYSVTINPGQNTSTKVIVPLRCKTNKIAEEFVWFQLNGKLKNDEHYKFAFSDFNPHDITIPATIPNHVDSVVEDVFEPLANGPIFKYMGCDAEMFTFPMKFVSEYPVEFNLKAKLTLIVPIDYGLPLTFDYEFIIPSGQQESNSHLVAGYICEVGTKILLGGAPDGTFEYDEIGLIYEYIFPPV